MDTLLDEMRFLNLPSFPLHFISYKIVPQISKEWGKECRTDLSCSKG
jgi:hypothetical protein